MRPTRACERGYCSLVRRPGRHISPYTPKARLNGFAPKSEACSPDRLRDADCVPVPTPHGGIDYEMMRTHSHLVVDMKNVLALGAEAGSLVRL